MIWKRLFSRKINISSAIVINLSNLSPFTFAHVAAFQARSPLKLVHPFKAVPLNGFQIKVTHSHRCNKLQLEQWCRSSRKPVTIRSSCKVSLHVSNTSSFHVLFRVDTGFWGAQPIHCKTHTDRLPCHSTINSLEAAPTNLPTSTLAPFTGGRWPECCLARPRDTDNIVVTPRTSPISQRTHQFVCAKAG